MAVGHVRPHFFEIDVGFRFHLLTFWAAIADVRFWSPAFMRTFLRTCQPKRRLQRLRVNLKIAVRDLSHDSSIRYKLGDMYTTIYVYDFPSRSSKLSSRSLRLGNKELLHTTQFQTALYTASGERRQLGIVPSCLRIILSFCVVRGQ